MNIYNAVGLIGTFIYLISYFLLVKGRIDGNGFRYILMNGLAASLVLFSLIKEWNLPSFVIQLCWLLISVSGLIMIYHRKRTSLK